MQTVGSRPVFRKDGPAGDFSVYFFSGMVPLQRPNAGVKVCPPDLHRFDSKSMRWQRVKCHSKTQAPIVGRKNFAMSQTNGLIFVTGGMDNGQNILSEFLFMDPADKGWWELRQVSAESKIVP